VVPTSAEDRFRRAHETPGRDVLIGARQDDCLVAADGEVDKLKGNLGNDRYEADDNEVIDG
jgi:hypothetical protein